MSNNIKQSGIRTLTHNEVNAVSGGFSLLPVIAAVVIKIIVPSLLEVFTHHDHKENKDNMSPPNDPGIPRP